MTKKQPTGLYNDVVGHEIYKHMVADLDDNQRADVERALQEFTKLLETGLLKPATVLTELARDEVATDMVRDAVEKAEKAKNAPTDDLIDDEIPKEEDE